MQHGWNVSIICQFKSGKEFDILPTVLCPKPDGLFNLIGHRVPRHSSASGTIVLDFLHTANIHPLVEHECSLNTCTRLSVLENWAENLRNQQHGSLYKDNYVSKCFCVTLFFKSLFMYYSLVGRRSIFAIRDFSVSFYYSSFHLIGMEIKWLDGWCVFGFISLTHAVFVLFIIN